MGAGGCSRPADAEEPAGARLHFSNRRAEKQIQTKGALSAAGRRRRAAARRDPLLARPGPRRPRPRAAACTYNTWLRLGNVPLGRGPFPWSPLGNAPGFAPSSFPQHLQQPERPARRRRQTMRDRGPGRAGGEACGCGSSLPIT